MDREKLLALTMDEIFEMIKMDEVSKEDFEAWVWEQERMAIYLQNF